jgi:hypothetical protein
MVSDDTTSTITRRDDRRLRGRWTRFQRHRFLNPGPDLAPFVARYWAVTWDLRGQRPYRQLVGPYPNVHLTFVNGVGRVHGVARGHVFRELVGLGRVFGVAFRPGCFRPSLRSPVSGLTDRAVPASDVFGPDVHKAAIVTAADETGMRHIVERFLLTNLPARDPVAEEVADIVARIPTSPPSPGRRPCRRPRHERPPSAAAVRSVRRRRAEVGDPALPVARHHRAHGGRARIDWAGRAADLGYADQAHLSRDFTAVVGESPTQYAQRYPDGAKRL